MISSLLSALLVTAVSASGLELSLALPSAKQLDFQNNHPIGCFFHFGINTFTGQEHGKGDASQPPSKFTAPVDLDTDQWVETCVKLGGTYAVLTAKHEEGMMNWPSNATDYTIATSPFCEARRKAGRSCDIVGEFLASCDKFNVTRGLYYTIFNNHCKAPNVTHCDNNMLRAAFKELATNYGPIKQFWFDHGNELFLDLIDQYQPDAQILGREWTLVGTEGGFVLSGADTIWYPDYPMGTANVSENSYIARQCDTSLSSSGWFWHGGAKPRFENASDAVDLYGLQCIGLGAGLILNLPPSTAGIVEPNFVTFVEQFHAEYKKRFGTPLGKTSGTLATTQGPRNGVLELDFSSGQDVDAVIVREDLRFGQRVSAWVLEANIGQPNGQKVWQNIGAGSTVGTSRIWSLRPAHGPVARTYPRGPVSHCFGVRFRPLASVAPDGLVHIAELSAFNSNATASLSLLV